MNFDFEGNSIFGKQAMTVGKSGFGDNLLSDYHWDNNVQFPSLLSRGMKFFLVTQFINLFNFRPFN
jgi:hypothetical protein